MKHSLTKQMKKNTNLSLKWLWLSSFLLIAMSTNAQIFVKHDASGANNGSSWTDAYASLQDALDVATPGDQIWVAAGTYKPSKDRYGNSVPNDRVNSFFIEKDSIKLYGGFNGTETALSQRNYTTNQTILSGDFGVIGDSTDNAYRVMWIYGGNSNIIGNEMRVDGFVIEKGNADGSSFSQRYGAGIWIDVVGSNGQSSPTIANCIIRNHYGQRGAGIYIRGQNGETSPIITNCIFENNNSSQRGGALYCYGLGTTGINRSVISNCTFRDNNCNFGGAVYNHGVWTGINEPLYIDCLFDNNTSISGGAVYNYAEGHPSIGDGVENSTFMNCTFTNNTGSFGGVIYNFQNYLGECRSKFINSTFSNNTGNSGGVVYNRTATTGFSFTSFTNCLFFDNTAGTGGAAYLTTSGGNSHLNKPSFNNCAFSQNNVNSWGGAVYNQGAEPFINNCIMWGNNGNTEFSSSSGNATFTNNIIGGSGGSYCWTSNLGTDNGGNLDFDPNFVDTANNNFRLLATSPAIDKGLNDSISINIDKDSLTRIFNSTVDLGAYEFQNTVSTSISLDSVVINAPSCPTGNGSITFHANAVGGTLEYSVDDGSTWQTSASFNSITIGNYIAKVRIQGSTLERTYPCPINLSASDLVAPIAATQNISAYLNNSGQVNISAADLNNGSTDNCTANLTFSADKTTFTCSDLGANTVTLTVTDASGNTDTETAIVTVFDTISPNAIAQSTTIFLDANGNATLTAAQINNGSSDNCDANPTLSINKTSFTCADLGTNNVTLTVTDANGNVGTSTVSVTVSDNISPTAITQNINAYLDATGQVNILPADVNNNSTDNCAGALTFSLDVTSFTCSNLGANTVNLTVTDVFGNSNSATATVTVFDTVSPVVQTQNYTLILDASGNGTISTADIDNGTADNCDPNPTLNLNTTNFTCANLGTNTVLLTATDVNGNVNAKTAIVTVVDNSNPTALTQNITVQLDGNGQVSILPTDIDNGSSDICDTNPSLSLDITSFDCSNIGANTVTLTVTDASGNSSSQTATVTVEDNVQPVMAIQDITVQLDANGQVSISPADIDNGTTDNCTTSPTLGLDITTFDCSNLGTNTVTLTAIDAQGNSNTQTAIVTVEDVTAPILSASDFTLELNMDGMGSISVGDITHTVVDNCDNNPSLSLDITQFDCNDLGTNTVTLTATDASGNSNSTTFTVTVVDNISPTITCQPFEWSVDATGMLNINPSDLVATVSDNCNYVLSTDITTLTFDNVGDNPITVTATDDDGNMASCISIVTILFDCVHLNNIITPNGDGKNDTWNIDCIGSMNNELNIYSPGGQTVFNATNYPGIWDGRNNDGIALPQGTYYFILRVLINGQDKFFKGNVTILK